MGTVKFLIRPGGMLSVKGSHCYPSTPPMINVWTHLLLRISNSRQTTKMNDTISLTRSIKLQLISDLLVLMVCTACLCHLQLCMEEKVYVLFFSLHGLKSRRRINVYALLPYLLIFKSLQVQTHELDHERIWSGLHRKHWEVKSRELFTVWWSLRK